MLNGIDTLETYFKKCITLEESKEEINKSNIKRINKLLKCIEERRYIIDLNEIQSIINEYEKTDVDSILNDIMLNVNRYNIYLMNKKVKFTVPVLDGDIPESNIKIDLKDILNYLDVKEEDLDKNLLSDLTKYVDFEEFENFAKLVKTSNDLERVLFDKILDKNVLVSILLHSNVEIVRNVIGIFKKYNANLNRIVNNIPYIFISERINDKCKYSVDTYYTLFIENVKLLEKYNVSFKNMMYHPVFFINDVNKNEEYILKFIDLGIKPSNVLEHVGNILVLNPDVIFNNINLLKFHGIQFTDDNNNNGYTILGMNHLDEKIDYYIEKEKWKNNYNGKKLDDLDLLRGLIINDGYFNWKNKVKYDIVDNASFGNVPLSEEKILKVYEQYPVLYELDQRFLENGNYIIEGNIISRHRLLKNLSNYKGSENALEESLRYKSCTKDIESVVAIILGLEMSGNSVNISQRI